MSDNPSRGSGSPWAAPAFFSTLLVVELIIDILPFDIFVDPVLIPAEAVIDIALLAASIYGRRHQSGGTSGGTSRELSSNGRAIGGAGIVAVAYWAFTGSIIVVQFWWNSQNPFLGFFAIFLEIPFDIVLILFGFYVTYKVLSAPRQSNVYAQPAREV